MATKKEKYVMRNYVKKRVRRAHVENNQKDLKICGYNTKQSMEQKKEMKSNGEGAFNQEN